MMDQPRLFDLPATDDVRLTLTQTKGLLIPAEMAATIMASQAMGTGRKVTFTGSGEIQAFGWDKGTLTYRVVIEDATFELAGDLRMVSTETQP